MHNGILLGHEKNEIMPFAATWMELEIIILCEVSQTEKDKYHIILLICGILKKKRYNWTYLQSRNRPIDIEIKLMVTKGWRGRQREIRKLHITMYKVDYQQELLHSTRNYTQYFVISYKGKEYN